MVSITRPSRGERWSATTTRQIGSFLPPTRVSLSLTATCSSLLPKAVLIRLSARERSGPWRWSPVSPGVAHERADVGHLAAPDLAHHLAGLAELLHQAVDVLHARP